MKQASLFEKQEEFETGINHIIKGLIQRGGLHKLLEVNIRAYQLGGGGDLSDVLMALEDVEAQVKGICLHLSEISSLRPLKKRNVQYASDMNKYFRSKFKDEEIVIESNLDEIKRISKELTSSYMNVSSTAFRILEKNGDVDLSDKIRMQFLNLWKILKNVTSEVDQIKRNAV